LLNFVNEQTTILFSLELLSSFNRISPSHIASILGFQVKIIQVAHLNLYVKTFYLTITTFKEGGFFMIK